MCVCVCAHVAKYNVCMNATCVAQLCMHNTKTNISKTSIIKLFAEESRGWYCQKLHKQE